MPDSRNRPLPPFDLAGYLLLAVGMVATTIALDGLADLGLAHAIVLVLLIRELRAASSPTGCTRRRAAQPIFSLDLFEIHTFSVGLLGNLFARIGSGAMPYLIPLLLQVSLGYTALQAGMMMLPGVGRRPAVQALVTRLIERYGYRRVLDREHGVARRDDGVLRRVRRRGAAVAIGSCMLAVFGAQQLDAVHSR